MATWNEGGGGARLNVTERVKNVLDAAISRRGPFRSSTSEDHPTFHPPNGRPRRETTRANGRNIGKISDRQVSQKVV